MSENRREKPRTFASDLNLRTPLRPAEPDAAPDLDLEEVAFLAEGLAFGPRALHAAKAKVTERYNLGPRGAWILHVLSHGVVYPLELASVFGVGRSLITAELARLTDAGLIDARPGEDDRRRTELTLSPLGTAALAEIRDEMRQIFRRRLAGFDASEVRLAAETLRALSREPG